MAKAAGNHLPNYPRGIIILRILQLVLALILLGLCSYAVYILAFAGDCLMLFTAIVTFIVSIWLVCCHSCTPQLYNYWAVLAFEIFLFIFWLISFCVLAAQTAYYWSRGSGYCSYYYCYSGGDLEGDDLIYGSILAAACGIGALEFLFFKISLIIHSIVIYRHRRAGGKSKPNGNGALPFKLKLQAQQKTDYEAVPQYGLPQNQDTAYNPQQLYNAPTPQQVIQPQQQSMQQTVSPVAQMQPQARPPVYVQQQQVSTPVPQVQPVAQTPVYVQQQQPMQQPVQVQLVQQQPVQQEYFLQPKTTPLTANSGGAFIQQTSTPPPQVMYQAPIPQPTPSPTQMAYQAPAHQEQFGA